MRCELQLAGALLCGALSLGCRRDRAVEFTLVEEHQLVRLTGGDCPPLVVESSALAAGGARFDPASGLTVSATSLQLRSLEPRIPAQPPPGLAFVATVQRAAPRDCGDADYEVPAAFFRARPVSVAQLEAGRFELRSAGSAPVGTTGTRQFSWNWSARFESAAPSDAPPPALESWDHCLAGARKPPDGLELAGARMGTVWLGDAGCDWLTATSEGGSRVARRHKVFGTILRFDAALGLTIAAPDVRVIAQQAVSMTQSFEWHDADGDGHHELERRAVFGPDGEEQRIEQIVFGDSGTPHQRVLITGSAGRAQHVVDHHFADGGWQLTSESGVAPGCAYEPVVPLRAPGK